MLAGGCPAFWTEKGAYAIPRKPGPILWAVPPTPIKPGRANYLGVRRDVVVEPNAGY